MHNDQVQCRLLLQVQVKLARVAAVWNKQKELEEKTGKVIKHKIYLSDYITVETA